MGRARRKKPERLAEKLLAIRIRLGLSQTALKGKIESDDYPIYKGDISNYELGKSEPPLVILLRYARLANVIVDVLIDDESNLP
ncbi:MAG: helix-turn-helix domain-containing protein [Pyrinomonadaceae bacterium]|nr:helix-turn-helix domain-containing protein [Pyrinomonadaceae bacterium]